MPNDLGTTWETTNAVAQKKARQWLIETGFGFNEASDHLIILPGAVKRRDLALNSTQVRSPCRSLELLYDPQDLGNPTGRLIGVRLLGLAARLKQRPRSRNHMRIDSALWFLDRLAELHDMVPPEPRLTGALEESRQEKYQKAREFLSQVEVRPPPELVASFLRKVQE